MGERKHHHHFQRLHHVSVLCLTLCDSVLLVTSQSLFQIYPMSPLATKINEGRGEVKKTKEARTIGKIRGSTLGKKNIFLPTLFQFPQLIS